MYFLDVMTFDPTLTKYISTDPTQTKFIFPTSTMVNTELEWAFHGFKGFAKNFFSKIRVYYGSGWVVPGLTRNLFGISSQNNSEPPS